MIDTIDRGEVGKKGGKKGGKNVGQNVGQNGLTEKDEENAEQETFRVWSREEARAWTSKNPPLSPWRVVGVQALVGLVCAAVIGALTQRSGVAWSALYGALTVVLPGALLARGMSRSTGGPAAAAANFMFWELVKIVVAVAMLVAVAKWAPGLCWPALLVAMVVCMKLGWLALLRRR